MIYSLAQSPRASRLSSTWKVYMRKDETSLLNFTSKMKLFSSLYCCLLASDECILSTVDYRENTKHKYFEASPKMKQFNEHTWLRVEERGSRTGRSTGGCDIYYQNIQAWTSILLIAQSACLVGRLALGIFGEIYGRMWKNRRHLELWTASLRLFLKGDISG